VTCNFRDARRLGFSALAATLCCLSPPVQIKAQIPDEIEVTRVASGLRFPVGLAWSRDGFMVIADDEKREIYRLDSEQRAKPTHQDPHGVQGIAYDTQSRLYMCETETRSLVRLDKRGNMETLAATFEGKKLNSPSDVAVRRDGHAYFTDPAFAGAIDTRELSFNGIFHVGPKGEIEAVARWQTRPNGIALSADGRRLFVSDADRHAVVEFDLDSKGTATNPRDFITGVQGVPAGLRLDAAGHLYVCATGLAIYNPDGKLFRTIMNTLRVLDCTFGDADLESLYVATPKDVYRVRIGMKGALQY
jgi:sugar lactone lactonase YvrE